ncbi:SDR family oxidoreductase [Elizabethkingia meningoseptica]|uniref:Short-chain dehydrogenase n=1 Tax=Elizabethkingia meningoseptica TaxID=238 RepID=A0A1T3K5P8_ELIME|nr:MULTISPECIES: SDR family oxidoreductase [Elizabethkingia]AQX05871.1 short-chain dehydrogenase [Elizabethkingia meningoseptica]AQX13408.1 short-chain dehydrogenase [Elizabethkingia meningoseptica]AQX47915.1 short-chain dehydrogenase [Elizabethkingia meningoseptica]EJK5327701.1 SDR family oxidoreductase [Elizabethkingia meningoseptica]EOR28806.1 short chain dehydrogenase [Elizabethkingia meningoseptica ATCC 13253 = NBRC 12535]
MLNNKVAYITGGTKGIGLGIASVLLNAGMKVAISGRNLEDAQAAAKQLSEDSSRVLAIQSNVRNYEDEANALQEIKNAFGQIDLVVANAGLGHFAPVDELSVEAWQDMIDTNLTGVFHTLKASIDGLKKSEGYFISIASLAGTNFFANGAGYNASKFGVVGFTQAAMLDLRKYNVKVSTIMPGSVKSHFNNHEPNNDDAWKIQPEDIGQLIVDMMKMNPRTLPSKVEIRPTLPR